MDKAGLIILIVIILALIAGGVYFFMKGKLPLSPESPTKKIAPSGVQVDVGSGLQNPLKNMPAVNPMEEAANPFRDSYKNPFKEQ